MITRIELVNFMSHTHTVLEPSDGLTVLVGPNNCGKSAVVAALQILAHNENSTYVMRHGEKETRITVWTDDGHEIEWRRKKSGGPSYTVDGTLFDRLGGGVPEEVTAALGLSKVSAGSDGNTIEFDLHFGEQKAPVFLIDRPASQAAQFFASSSDAEKLVRMQTRHKEKIRDAKRDRVRLQAEKGRLERALTALAPVDDIDARVTDAEARYEAIAEREQSIAEAGDLDRRLSQTRARAEAEAARAEALEALIEPPELADLRPAERLIAGLSEVGAARAAAESAVRALAALSAPPVLADTAGLEAALAALSERSIRAEQAARTAAAFEPLSEPPAVADTDGLSALISKLEAAADSAEAAQGTVADALAAESAAREELRALAAREQTCPTCGAELDPERLVRAAETGTGGHAHG